MRWFGGIHMEEGGLKEKCPETYRAFKHRAFKHRALYCHRVKTIEMKRLHSLSIHAAEEKRIMIFPLVFKRELRRRIRLERICGTEKVQDLCGQSSNPEKKRLQSECQSRWMTNIPLPLPCQLFASRNMINGEQGHTNGLDLCLSAGICPDYLFCISVSIDTEHQCLHHNVWKYFEYPSRPEGKHHLCLGENGRSFNSQRWGALARLKPQIRNYMWFHWK